MFFAQQVLKTEHPLGLEIQEWDGSQQSMECYLDLLAQEIVGKLHLENSLAEHKKYKDLLEDRFVQESIA